MYVCREEYLFMNDLVYHNVHDSQVTEIVCVNDNADVVDLHVTNCVVGFYVICGAQNYHHVDDDGDVDGDRLTVNVNACENDHHETI